MFLSLRLIESTGTETAKRKFVDIGGLNFISYEIFLVILKILNNDPHLRDLHTEMIVTTTRCMLPYQKVSNIIGRLTRMRSILLEGQGTKSWFLNFCWWSCTSTSGGISERGQIREAESSCKTIWETTLVSVHRW